MRYWPKHPLIYEINTWVWLDELSRKAGCHLTLASVPYEEWEKIAAMGFDAIWLMGVWERSPEGIRISITNNDLLADFQRALPDFTNRDNVGSPYCVRRYVVDAHLGGPQALSHARKKLAGLGLRLILDFVPNHVAPDHPWVDEHPEYFIQGDEEDFVRDTAAFFRVKGKVFAQGRDPFFPAWPDVLQLNAFSNELRSAITAILSEIADQCDAVRCDMAMLLLHSIFVKTWGSRAGSVPDIDYWFEIISTVRKKHPDFLFVAEAYWDMEWELQQQGFDFCYDKCLYDRLRHDPAERVRLHLCADIAYQEKLVRFIENHDEPRAAVEFIERKHRAAALVSLTLPGARLIHEGQLEGRKVRLPVFLARRPEELSDHELLVFYEKLLDVLHRGDFLKGTWRLCECIGWPDNRSCENLVSWTWQNGDSCCLIVVNLSGSFSQGLIKVVWDEMGERTGQLEDVFTSAVYEGDEREMAMPGLYVELPAWGYHFFIWRQREIIAP
jgi:hypothetical protein